MGAIRRVPSSPASASELVFEGSFDQRCVHRLLEAVRELSGPVDIDLCRVSQFHDAALAQLVEVLAHAPPGRVVLHGLGEHQRRILRYLGVPPGTYAPREMEGPTKGER